jgi:hypothetical protein
MSSIYERAENYRKEIDKLKKQLEAYEQFEGEVEYAMNKVGWNNSRIESAYNELQDNLKRI